MNKYIIRQVLKECVKYYRYSKGDNMIFCQGDRKDFKEGQLVDFVDGDVCGV